MITGRIRSIWGDSIIRQMLLLIAASIFAGQLANLLIVQAFPPRPSPAPPLHLLAARTKTVLQEIESAPPGKLESILRDHSDGRIKFAVTAVAPPLISASATDQSHKLLAAQIGVSATDVRFGMVPMGSIGAPAALTLPVPPGPGQVGSIGPMDLFVRAGKSWLVVRSSGLGDTAWLMRVVTSLGITLLLVIPIAIWLAHRLASRVRRFAHVAERFGTTQSTYVLAEDGPLEVRQVAGALNRMQNRIQRLLSERTAMAAAVSHDLCTPLARIRFRTNALEPDIRDAIAEDVQQINDIIASALAFATNPSKGRSPKHFDLAALIQGLVDERVDSGANVQFEQPSRAPVNGSPIEIQRALNNLLDNALKFAGAARVTLQLTAEFATVAVEDDGPGIPIDSQETVFEPFHRLEPSRNRETGGTGLGLAIARSLAQANGGNLVLDTTYRNGARFLLSVPLLKASADAPTKFSRLLTGLAGRPSPR